MSSSKNNLVGNPLSVLLILVLWGILTGLGIFDSFLVPSPIEVIVRLYELFLSAEILSDLTSTLMKIMMALVIGSLSGTMIGVLISRCDSVYQTVTPLIDFFRSVPATALFPLFLLIFGAGDSTNIALAMWICALYLSLHVSKGLRSTSEAAIITAKSLKKSELETLIHIRFKEALPVIFVGFRTAVSLTVVLIVVTEMFVGTKEGIGKALIDASYMYDIPKLYAIILIIGLIGYFLNQAIIRIEQRVVHWHGK